MPMRLHSSEKTIGPCECPDVCFCNITKEYYLRLMPDVTGTGAGVFGG